VQHSNQLTSGALETAWKGCGEGKPTEKGKIKGKKKKGQRKN
jgi:hypothetical protein